MFLHLICNFKTTNHNESNAINKKHIRGTHLSIGTGISQNYFLNNRSALCPLCGGGAFSFCSQKTK